MRRDVLLVLLVFFSLPAVSQENPSRVSSPHEGSILGHVIFADTRLPVRGALVMIAPVPSADSKSDVHVGSGMGMARTHLDGSYLVQHLGAGVYTAFVFSPGYLSRFQEVTSAEGEPKKQQALLAENGTVSLRGVETATLNVVLQRGAAISGRVLYSDGSPAVSVTLVLDRAGDHAPSTNAEKLKSELASNVFQHSRMDTDDQGRYRLVGLQPGTYRVAVTQPLAASDYGEDDPDRLSGLSLFDGVADPRSLRFYSGDTYHRASAKTFKLHDGEEVRGVDFTLPIEGLHEVRGSVEAKDGEPVTSGQISLTDDADPQLVFYGAIHRNGTYRFQQVPPGTYSLAVSGAREADGVSTVAVRSGSTPSGVALADTRLAVIVQDDDLDGVDVSMNPIPGADVEGFAKQPR